jgi:hypothetical protein
MTLGEYRVGITFNPSGNPQVEELKRAAAHFIDLCDKFRTDKQYSEHLDRAEVERLFFVAMVHAEDAAMWAVKAITKSPRD